VFRDQILAEMMAQITPDGHNHFWDHLGRRFIPLSYTEADRLCQYSREFMMSLLPREPIYLSLLPPEPRAGVGQVGTETIPARRMLEKLGFEYHGFVDPFDGGPYLHAETDEVPLIKNTRFRKLGEPVAASKCKTPGIVSILHSDGDFYAVNQPFMLDNEGRVRVTREVMSTLQANAGDKIGVTDMTPPLPVDETAKPARKSVSKKAASKRTNTKNSSKKTSALPQSQSRKTTRRKPRA
jgi:arginine/ornithine succinyltransferase subunit-like protein